VRESGLGTRACESHNEEREKGMGGGDKRRIPPWLIQGTKSDRKGNWEKTEKERDKVSAGKGWVL